MKIIDISMPIFKDMVVYKNKEEKKPQIITQSSHDQQSSHETFLGINLHTGTHIDAPLHMIKDGATIGAYPLEQFFGPCKVLDLTHCVPSITKKDLQDKDIQANDFILLKTKNSKSNHFDFDFIYLDETAALFLAEKKVRGVGIDALGIERNQEKHPTHKILLSQNIAILEGLRLNHVAEKSYLLIALPINIPHVEAAPTRAVLIEA